MMKPAVKWTLIVAAVIIPVGGWIVYFHNEAVASRFAKWPWAESMVKHLGASVPEEASADEDPDNTKNEIPVHTAHIGTVTLHRTIEGIGAVAPRPARHGEMAGSANIAPATAGVVSQILCQIGDRVKAGDSLIQLDNRLAKAAADQAEAGFKQAVASRDALKAQPRPDQLQIGQSAVDKAQSAMAFAQKNYERTKELAAAEGVSAKGLEQAAQDLAGAQNDLTVAQRQLSLLKPTAEELAQEEAKVTQAEAGLAAAKAQLEMMTIKAPIDATVASISVNPGEPVDTTRVIVQLVATDRLMVSVTVPPEQLPGDSGNLMAEVRAAASVSADEPVISGKVAAISPGVDPRNGSVTIDVDLPGDAGLRSGLSVRVRIIAEEHKDVLAVPKEAVVTDENGDSVIAIVEGDQATHKTVKRGLEENGMVEITADGLKEGMTVVTAGAFGLPQATRVKVID